MCTTDSYNWIAQKVTVSAVKAEGDNYTGTYSFTIPENHDGDIIIQVNAIDTDGRASQASYWQITTGGKAGPTTTNWWYYSYAVTAVLAIAAVLTLLAIWWYMPVSYRMKLIMSLGAVIGFIFIGYSMFGGV